MAPFIAEVSLNRVMAEGTPYVAGHCPGHHRRKKDETSLKTVTKNSRLLNTITFEEIRNAIFALKRYLSLDKSSADMDRRNKYLDKEEELVNKISKSLTFARVTRIWGSGLPSGRMLPIPSSWASPISIFRELTG